MEEEIQILVDPANMYFDGGPDFRGLFQELFTLYPYKTIEVPCLHQNELAEAGLCSIEKSDREIVIRNMLQDILLCEYGRQNYTRMMHNLLDESRFEVNRLVTDT